MVKVTYDPLFDKKFKKIKDAGLRSVIKKRLLKIIDEPTIGKPMQYERQRTREVYISSFRLSYMWLEREQHIYFLDLYHKDEQ